MRLSVRKDGLLTLFLSLVMLLPGPGAQDPGAQDPGANAELQSSLSASYGFAASSKEFTDSGLWTSGQWVSLGYFGRWGSALTVQGDLSADFSSRALTADSLLPQLMLTWNATDSLVATLGKQRLMWGTARVFPSLDRLEPLADPSVVRKLIPGVTGVRLEYLPSDWLSVQILGMPAEKLADSLGALRLDFLVWDLDLALGVQSYRGLNWKKNMDSTLAIHRSLQVAAYAEISWFGDRFGLYADTQVRSSRDRAYYLLPVGDPTGLPSLYSDADTGLWINLTTGFQTEIPLWHRQTGTFLVEYHFQGDGWKEGEMKDIGPLLAGQLPGDLSFRPQLGTLRHHYFYAGLSGMPLWGGTTGVLSLISGPESGFWLASGTLDWRLDEFLSLTAGYRHAGQWFDDKNNPGDLLLLSWKTQVSVGISGSF